MSLVDIAALPRVVDPQLSPDGKTLVYMLSEPDWTAGRPIYHLWRQDTRGGAPVQLTTGAGDTPGSTRWSPDGTSVLFLRAGQLMLLAPGAGAAPRAITKHATPVSSPAWSPDGGGIYFVAADAPSVDDRERERRRDDIYALDENVRARQLWNVSVASGAENAITSGPSSVLSYRLSRDGSLLVVSRGPTPLEDDRHRAELWLMDAAGGHAREVTHNDVEETQPELSPDNTRILFVAETNEKLEPYYNWNLFVMPATGGTPKPLLPDFQYAIDQAAWSPDGSSILAVANMGVHSEIIEIDASTRQWRPLTSGDHYIPPTWSVVPQAGQMVFQFDEPSRFGDVWTLAIPATRTSAAAAPVRLTGAFDTLEKTFALPRQEKVAWKGADGRTVEGLLFYPTDYVAGRRYPLVVQMHGGPARFGQVRGWSRTAVELLSRPDRATATPCSGRTIAAAPATATRSCATSIGNYFRNMHLDVMAGVDALVKRGIADPDRLVVMGWSAGGHLTNKLVTFTTASRRPRPAPARRTGCRCTRRPMSAAIGRVWFGGTPVAEERADRPCSGTTRR